MALLSHFLPCAIFEVNVIREAPMIDNQEKAGRLLTALKAAVPFEVEVLPAVLQHLQTENRTITNPTRQVVSDLSYAGDEGGIVCHIAPDGKREALIMSLTHVRVPRTNPLAASIIDYQKHRIKKLKKQRRA
jgi:hypothetical protein